MKKKQVIIVTGGSRGIGAAICDAFAEPDAIIVVNYHNNAEKAQKIVAALKEKGAQALAIKADVSNSKQVLDMTEKVIDKFGQIDILINNAGTTKNGFLMLMDETDWDFVINTNLKGVFNCCKAVSRHMIERKKGAIVNISSLSGITGLAGQANYSAAKGGINAFTKSLAKELAPFGIRVNAVAPGMIETDLSDEINDKTKKEFTHLIPLKRFGTPEEVSHAVCFLASQKASYITGEVIVVSGGIN